MPPTHARGRPALETASSHATGSGTRSGQQGSASEYSTHRRVDPSEPLENCYKDQLLQKLEHLSTTKYHQLRKSKKTTIIKAIHNLESNALPVQQQQHLGIEQQQQQLHTTGRQQNDRQIQDVNDISMEDGTTLEDHIESTVRRILPKVVQVVISTQHRHDSSSPSMDCGSTTGTNRNMVTEQSRPTCGPIETRQHASECIIQSQGPVNYLGAQQTDFESLSAGTSAG